MIYCVDERKSEMKYDHVLWDFNGTLLNDVQICVDCLNELLAHHGSGRYTEEEYKNIFTFPIKEYYERAGFDFEKTGYDVLAEEWTEYYRSRSDLVLYDGAKTTLEKLAAAGAHQSIISASERTTLFSQTRVLGIDGFFDEMLGLDNIHARSKENIAMLWRERNPLSKAVFIGDTTHDCEVARAIDADCILIPNGHQARRILETTSATICDGIKDIPQMLL